jgi:hypothetical protein
LTARLLARSSRSFKSVLASLAASSASRRLSSGSPEVSRYTARAPVAVARVRTAFESGSGEGYPGCTTLRAARERAHVADREVYLVGGLGVELEVTQASAAGWGEACGLPAGRDGLLQPADPGVDLACLKVGVLGAFCVAALQSASHLFQHGRRIVEEGVGGLFHHALGVDGEQGVYE